MKSCVVGIGAMGLEMALHIQDKGMDVVGVDLDQKQIAEAKQRGLSAGEDLASQVSGVDVHFGMDSLRVGEGLLCRLLVYSRENYRI